MATKRSSESKQGTGTSDKLERRTVSEDVARVLRDRILDGYYPPGQFIRQDDIATQLGVSQVPVREALRSLNADGLVTLVKYRGALVPKLSLDEWNEISELRQLIECYLARHAVQNISSDQISELESILTKCERLRTPTSEWVALNIQFHLSIFAASKKPLALQSLENLLLRTNRYIKAQPARSTPDKARSDAEHREILELIKTKDVERTVALFRAHIGSHAERIRESLD